MDGGAGTSGHGRQFPGYTPEEHIEKIRRDRFYIGREEKNPLAEDIHHAVNYLSEELYSKDVHFLMELIQNAEDNEYPAGVEPSLQFLITSEDITATGAASTLIVFNNEKGFSPANIESLCRIGKSTKKGNRQKGFIGEKGIGFKSVFIITKSPYIFSNGYQIRFNEEPSPECHLGYIVPEWINKNPVLSDIQRLYGVSEVLPTTTIILPLKCEKVVAVKQQLSAAHPELLLFLSKITRLSISEDKKDPERSTVKEISLSSEINFQRRKSMNADSYTLHLSAHDSEGEEQCSYYMWRQRFPVKSDCQVTKRKEVEEWDITLAFPFGERLKGMKSPGVYAFLPTEMTTNFPFIMQADFILVSSRESILLDNKWNNGILGCVAPAFINAFRSLLKSTEDPPLSSLPHFFRFLPLTSASIPLLESLRLSIKAKMVAEYIIPCESYTSQKIFCKPDEVGRLLPAFWDILHDARKCGVDLQNLSSHGSYILNHAFDKKEWNDVLEFLGVRYVGSSWYAKCIQGSSLALQVSDKVYIKLLCFFADNWDSSFLDSNANEIPLLKYLDHKGRISLWSIHRATSSEERICLFSKEDHVSWLVDWNQEFGDVVTKFFFIPSSTWRVLNSFPRKTMIIKWLQQHARVLVMSVYDYCCHLLTCCRNSPKMLITLTHLLCHSIVRGFVTDGEILKLCNSLPLVDNYGYVATRSASVLVPAKGSMWVELLGSNPWPRQNYIELSENYLLPASFAGNRTSEGELLPFLRTQLKASDVPHVQPPDATVTTFSSSLTQKNVFILLRWIKTLMSNRTEIPRGFLECVRNGCWLRTSAGDSAPCVSFFSSSEWGGLLEIGSMLVDIPLIDQAFYGDHLHKYKNELKALGVLFEYGEACRFIGKRIMSLAASSGLTRSNVHMMLKFMRFLKDMCMSPKDFVESVKTERWLMTSHGKRFPVGAVLFSDDWKCSLAISNPPFINHDFYGELHEYKDELQLLGIIVGFDRRYQLMVDNFRLSAPLYSMSPDKIFLLLDCLRHAKSTESIVMVLKTEKWVKTTVGYKKAFESMLCGPELDCFLKIVDGIPIIDTDFYGSKIMSYQEELKLTGVLVGFDEISRAIAERFKKLVESSSFRKENVIGLLACYRHLRKIKGKLPEELKGCVRKEKWVKTKIGYRSPSGCVLFDGKWKEISTIAVLPFVDDREEHYGKDIHDYRNELKALGVVVDFEEGLRFVVAGLNIPEDATKIPPRSVLSLLNCIKHAKDPVILSSFEKPTSTIKRKWVNTSKGYRSPEQSILYGSTWISFLKPDDGPFILNEFYGPEISSYRLELEEIGVIVDVANGCSLLASCLTGHTLQSAIVRIYNYLCEFKWEPEKDANWIWIPAGDDTGKWVSPKSCVLHDEDNLFSSMFHVLDKHYEQKLLHFFSLAFGVRRCPGMADYCSLWHGWEQRLDSQLTLGECRAFWVHVANNWVPNPDVALKDTITKLPVSVNDEIILRAKQDVFIPDDLLLRDLFDGAPRGPFSVWCPQNNEPFLTRTKLYEIYRKIGVRELSQSVEKCESSTLVAVTDCTQSVNLKRSIVRRGLLHLVLGFLADSSLDVSVEKRHQIVDKISELDVLVTEGGEPVTLDYSLPLSSGETIKVKANRVFRLEPENSRLLVQKDKWVSWRRRNMECATYFSDAISEMLWEMPNERLRLAELIRLGCLVNFEEKAIDFLLKSQNLQLSSEDQEFLREKMKRRKPCEGVQEAKRDLEKS